METDSKRQRVNDSGDVHDGVGIKDEAAPLSTAKPEEVAKETPAEDKIANNTPPERESKALFRTPKEESRSKDEDEDEKKPDPNNLQLNVDLPSVLSTREEWVRIEVRATCQRVLFDFTSRSFSGSMRTLFHLS
jgi:hypothetical protein